MNTALDLDFHAEAISDKSKIVSMCESNLREAFSCDYLEDFDNTGLKPATETEIEAMIDELLLSSHRKTVVWQDIARVLFDPTETESGAQEE